MIFHDIEFLKRIKFIRYFYFKWLIRTAKKNENKEVVSKTLFNFKMLLTIRDWVQYNIFVYGQYEPNESKLFHKLCRQEVVVFDIGANVGYFSLIAALANSKNLVYAFEPVKKNYDRLSYNIDLNKLKNINVFKNIVSNSTEESTINIGNDQNWGMSSVVQHNYLSGETETVQSITMDNFVRENEIRKIDLVKIDVEGFELNVLQGMTESLKQFKPIVLIEILEQHLKANGCTVDDIYCLLWECGYKSYKILAGGFEPITIPQSINGLVYFKHNSL